MSYVITELFVCRTGDCKFAGTLTFDAAEIPLCPVCAAPFPPKRRLVFDDEGESPDTTGVFSIINQAKVAGNLTGAELDRRLESYSIRDGREYSVQTNRAEIIDESAHMLYERERETGITREDRIAYNAELQARRAEHAARLQQTGLSAAARERAMQEFQQQQIPYGIAHGYYRRVV